MGFYVVKCRNKRESCKLRGENVMVDKNGNIIPSNSLLKRSCSFIKENTAQMAIIIPILVAIYAAVSNYYLYIVNYGYYKYFKIDNSLMLPYNKVNLYQNITQLVLIGLYLELAMLAVRIFFIKRNYLEKFMAWIVLPLVINAIIVMISYSGSFNMILIIISSIIFLPIQWILMFIAGYAMMKSFQEETLDKPKKQKRNKEKHWSYNDYRRIGIIIIVVVCIGIFLQGCASGYRTASEKKRFGIVEINEEQYVVIDANENKMILQKCEIKEHILKINYNTYLCVKNERIINFETFHRVELVDSY